MKRNSTIIHYHPSVAKALKTKKPILALESTIISHGVPYPNNVKMALRLQEIALDHGAVPATIAIIKGKLHIGLTPREIEYLAKTKGVLKVSRPDFATCMALDLDGATTVAGTMIAADMANIKVFATGGIGGVHRGAEDSFDISADLTELSQTPVVVVSAGAKAILDLPKTIEYLETQGVPIIGYNTEEFPAFYSRSSGIRLYHKVTSAAQIAKIYKTHLKLGFNSGILVANPIPAKYEIPSSEIGKIINIAVKESKKHLVAKKDLTPFLLSKILELTKGRSLASNLKLVENNVMIGAQIAVQIAKEKV
ncbi:MAG: pseudouridine-5'-phosphate glycosidase [Oligoflexia bacterium]|nr:pseudouridine-5'-phosphate glycosidase [Oligoflexia bacterium]